VILASCFSYWVVRMISAVGSRVGGFEGRVGLGGDYLHWESFRIEAEILEDRGVRGICIISRLVARLVVEIDLEQNERRVGDWWSMRWLLECWRGKWRGRETCRQHGN